MKLIGAGLPRTATLSQKIALEMLGLDPCYHMVNVLADLDQAALWRAALDGQAPASNALEGFQATVDWPGSFFYQELIDTYPDAKVLLSVRDADAWARSMHDTIWGLFYDDILIRHLAAARASIDAQWDSYMTMMREMWQRSGLVDGAATTPEYMSSAFERYTHEVQAVVPPERLLVWTPGDGWEPLCEFLELPVPEIPFPRVNDSHEFAGRIVDSSLIAIQNHIALGQPETQAVSR
jgi:hypothetical protein